MNKARYFVIAVSVVAAFAFLIRADREALRSADTPTNVTPLVGVGYWMADTGDVIELRDDGTGRSRHLVGDTVHECEFDWACDGNVLTIKNFPNVFGSFMAQFTGFKSADFSVVSATDDVFVFRHNGLITLTRGRGYEQPTIPATSEGEPSDAPESASRLGVRSKTEVPRAGLEPAQP